MLIILFIVVIVFLSLVYGEEDQIELLNDLWLRRRMQELNIASWRELRQRANLSLYNLRLLRDGQINRLNLKQLASLAAALDWGLEVLLQRLGITLEADDTWRLECLRLRNQLDQCKEEVTEETQADIFNQLQTLLTNYPSLRRVVQIKPELPAKNVIALFTPLDNLLNSWDYQPIGQAWAEVEYSPQLHQADSSDIQPGEKVYVRLIGYRKDEKIITPAKVSRSLPGGNA